jgi:subtilisin family serine protease
MKRLLCVVFALVAARAEAAVVGDDVLRALAAGERVRVVIALRAPAASGKSANAAQAAIQSLQSRVLAGIDDDAFRRLDAWRSTAGLAGELSIGGLSALANHPDVLRIDRDSGGEGALLESVPLVGGTAAHARGFRGAGVTIAIIDSGVEATHPDLAGAVVDERCFCAHFGGEGCCPNQQREQRGPGAAADDQGHGTGVAGTLLSRGVVAGVGMAPAAKLVAVKVLDSSNRFDFASQITSALDFILTEHPEVRVVNLSLGLDGALAGSCDNASAETMLWARQVAALRARGTAVTASSGNAAQVGSITAPACVSGVWGVGATYDAPFRSNSFSACSETDTNTDDIVCFSNTSTAVSFLAPGAIITTSGRGGKTQRLVGTSFAAPHVAGAAAVLFAMKPSATVAEIANVLATTGKPIRDKRTGATFVRIDLGAAASELAKTLTPAPPRRRAATP